MQVKCLECQSRRYKSGNPEYELRQKGKVAELALGYQGGSGALIQMGALDKGLTEDELPEIVKRWRAANKRIVDLWYTVQNCAINCILTGQTQVMQKNIYFSYEHRDLVVTLPSKRQLFYISPKIATNSFRRRGTKLFRAEPNNKEVGKNTDLSEGS